MEEKVKELLEQLSRMEEEKSTKAQFCREHNFGFQADIESLLERQLRRVQRIIERHLQ